MPFTALFDADVLHPAGQRDLLIRLAQVGLFRGRWTVRILDEMEQSIIARHPEHAGKLTRTRDLMCEAVPDCLVTGYEDLIEALTLPDPDDRHVLAAAIRCGAQVLVTNNQRDFPQDVALRGCGLRHRDRRMRSPTRVPFMLVGGHGVPSTRTWRR